MTKTIWTVMQRVDGDNWIAVATKDSERAAKLWRTKERADSDREYQIIPMTVSSD